MRYTINEYKERIFREVYAVYDIFKNFFGEELVDLQNTEIEYYFPADVSEANLSSTDISDEQIDSLIQTVRFPRFPFILVYWPTVTVTNEYDRSIDIQGLYAKVYVTLDGKIPLEYVGFNLNRSRYSDVQYRSGYLHSHIQGIPSDPSVFMKPCLGHGPINNTIATLKIENDEATWMLFCQELSMYVTVESIRGVPWRRMDSVGRSSTYPWILGYDNLSFGYYTNYKRFYDIFSKEMTKTFLRYYLENGNLKLMYCNGRYQAGIREEDFLLDISDAFINFCNRNVRNREIIDELWSQHFLRTVMFKSGKLYTLSDNANNNPISAEGRHVCFFKGQDIRLKIDYTDTNTESHSITVLDFKLCNYFLMQLLKIINFRYGQNREETSSDYQRVFYV